MKNINLSLKGFKEVQMLVEYYQTTDGINSYREFCKENEDSDKMEIDIDGNDMECYLTIIGDGEDIDKLIFDFKDNDIMIVEF